MVLFPFPFFFSVVDVVRAVGRKTVMCLVGLCCYVEKIVLCITVWEGGISGRRLMQPILHAWEGIHLLRDI